MYFCQKQNKKYKWVKEYHLRSDDWDMEYGTSKTIENKNLKQLK